MNHSTSQNEFVALIIGISNSVVQQAVLELARQGFIVIYADCNQELVELLKQRLTSQGSRGWGVHCDYWDITGMKSLFNQVKEGYRNLDLVIGNLNLECDAIDKYQDSELVSLCINRTFRICAESWLQMVSTGGVIMNVLPVKAKASSKSKETYSNAGLAITQLSEKFSNDCVPYHIHCSFEELNQEDECFANQRESQLVKSIVNHLKPKSVGGEFDSGVNVEGSHNNECISE